MTSSNGDDHLSVAPASDDSGTGDAGTPAGNNAGGRDPRQDAGRDRSIDKRLQKHPDSSDAQLDAGLDESMDASDPVSSTQPGHSSKEAPDATGYNADAEGAAKR